MRALLLALGACASGTIPIDSGTPGDSGLPCELVDWYADIDGDGFGAGDPIAACDAPDETVADATDCDDGARAIHPGAVEVCDGRDDDCDGAVDDEAIDAVPWFEDRDADGVGAADLGVACAPPEGAVGEGGDCDDDDPTVRPGVAEVWTDWVDTDCDGVFEHPQPVEVTFAGEAASSSWQRRLGEEVAVHVVVPGGGGLSRVDVQVEHPVVLVLVADGRVFRVTETWPGVVQAVYLLDRTTDGGVIADAPVTRIEKTFSYDWDRYDNRGLDAFVEETTGLRMQSFSGSSLGNGAIVLRAAADYPESPYPDCDSYTGPTTFPTMAPDTAPVEALCPAVTAESAWCLTSSGYTLTAVGQDSGATCAVGTLAAPATSMAWIGEHLYTCGGPSALLVRQDVATGAVEKNFVYCSGVTEDGDRLLTIASWTLAWHTSWEDAACGTPVTATASSLSAERYKARDGVLWTTWHSTGKANRLDLATLLPLTPLPFAGFDGWTQGLDVQGDRLYVLTGTASSMQLRAFDTSSGEQVGSVPAPTSSQGLACVRNE